jgi:IS30 family transposase
VRHLGLAGVLKRELAQHLRRGGRSSAVAARCRRRGAILDGVSIHARAPRVASRAEPGHWEAICWVAHNSHIATLVKRADRFVVLVREPGQDSLRVVDALLDAAHRLSPRLVRSLTWDHGSELAQHRRFTLATDVQVYFCDPTVPGSATRTRTGTAAYGSISERHRCQRDPARGP